MDNEEIKTNEPEVLHTYKGVNKDMTAHGGFKYEVGVEYEAKGDIKACNNGFHACEMPLDVFNYFPPASSRYFECEQSGDISKDSDDTKVASRKIKLGAEIGIPGLVKAQIEYVSKHLDKSKPAATNTGYMSAATNTGYRSAATNTGYRSAATNTGDMSAATNTGNRSAATNTGDRSAATNTGDRSAATNTGDMSAATNTGYRSAATNTGNRSAATNTGDRSAATNTGKGGVAIVTGYGSKARGTIGSAICICERGEWNGNEYPLLAIKAGIVDGEVLKPDTWYTLKNGEFVEVEEKE